MKIYTRAYAKINLDNIVKNVDSLMNNTAEGTKALAVIKTDAYGHGDIAVAKAIYDKVAYYAVATLMEAVNLRKNGIDKPILILGYVSPMEYELLVENDIDAVVFDEETADELSKAAKKLNKTAYCHIKADTGMRRIGLEPDQSGIDIVKKIVSKENVCARGIFTHFAASDELDKTSANKQFDKFNKFVDALKKEGIEFEYVHCSNSAAIIDMPEANKDMVRLGIALYGMYPSDEVDKNRVKLYPALELKSFVTMVKTVPAGEKISYGGTFTTNKSTKIATVSIGYGDGYPRNLSNKGYVLIHGQKAPIRGRVCMDQFMIDVTDIDDVKRGDEVTLIGKDGDNCITVEEMAGLAGTFNYEFVCDINKRVPRIYYMNGEYIGSHDHFIEDWDLKNI